MGNIHKKLQKIQAELKVPKSKYSEYGGYSYRSLEDIYEAVKPLLDREGLILAVNDEIIMLGNRFYIKATRHRKRGQFLHYSIRQRRRKQKKDGCSTSYRLSIELREKIRLK